MKFLSLIFIVFLIVGCNENSKDEVKKPNTNTIQGSIGNKYEIIKIGPYTCVGMDGYKSGSLWCERTKREF